MINAPRLTDPKTTIFIVTIALTSIDNNRLDRVKYVSFAEWAQ